MDVIEENKGLRLRPSRLRRKAVALLDSNGQSPPLFERFMSLLEKVSAGSDEAEISDDEAPRPYKVSTTDLTNVRKALERMTHDGMPMWALTVKLYRTHANRGRSSRSLDELPSGDQLSQYHEYDILAERRSIEKEKNRRQRLAGQPPSLKPPKRFLSKAEVDELRAGQEKTNESLREERRRLRAEIEEMRATHRDTRNEAHRGDEMESLRTNNRALRENVRRLEDERDSLIAANRRLHDGSNKQAELDELREKVRELDELRERVREKAREKVRELDELREKARELDELREKVRRFEQQGNDTLD